MSHAVYKSFVVIRLLVQQLVKVGFDGLLIVVIIDMLLYIVHHIHNLKICTAVFPSFKG